MVWYILAGFTIVYVFNIVKSFLQVRKIKNLIEIIVRYLKSATITTCDYPNVLRKNENYVECMNDLLFNYPAISQFTTFYSKQLAYGMHDLEVYQATIEIYQELLMERNFLINDLCASFNPIRAIKILFCIPSIFIEWIGFRPGKSLSKILNAICWVITYLLGMYSVEIKTLITSLLEKLL